MPVESRIRTAFGAPADGLGHRRLCRACGAPFYDLERRPVSCPWCGAPQDSGTLLRRGVARLERGPAGRGAPERVPLPEDEADLEDSPASLPEDDEDASVV